MVFAECAIGGARWKCGLFVMQESTGGVTTDKSEHEFVSNELVKRHPWSKSPVSPPLAQKPRELVGGEPDSPEDFNIEPTCQDELCFNELVESRPGSHPSLSPPASPKCDEFLADEPDSPEDFNIESDCQVDKRSTRSISSLSSTVIDVDTAGTFDSAESGIQSISAQTSETASFSSLDADACSGSLRGVRTELNTDGHLVYWSQYQPPYTKMMSQPARTRPLASASLLKMEWTLTSCKEHIRELEAQPIVTIEDCGCLLDTLCSLASDALAMACTRDVAGAMELHTAVNETIDQVAIVLERSSYKEH